MYEKWFDKKKKTKIVREEEETRVKLVKSFKLCTNWFVTFDKQTKKQTNEFSFGLMCCFDWVVKMMGRFYQICQKDLSKSYFFFLAEDYKKGGTMNVNNKTDGTIYYNLFISQLYVTIITRLFDYHHKT